MTRPIHIVGGGMAGAEAAWQVAHAGLPVIIHEMRPARGTFAHRTGLLAEMVCSNSLRSDDDENNAVGLLHWEMRRAGGLIIAAADANALPAGGALAVDRDRFAEAVTARLHAHPLVTVETGEVTSLPPPDWGEVIIATGPLTSDALGEAIRAETGEHALAFFDAIAPIVHFDTIDLSKAWFQSRYDKGETEAERTAYLNCPMDRDQYEAFIDALLAAEKTVFHEGETAGYFDGCLPIEVMAERGRETLRHGPMKPVGLTNPHQPDVKAHAVVQLRRDNRLGTLYNIVGFQTKMKHGAQTDVFRMIPGLENARFARLGGIHRNTFLNSPRLLDGRMCLRSQPHIRFAGQITGVEGYVESAAMGLVAGRLAAARALGREMPPPPPETAMGALIHHITGGAEAATFQPMNVNFGLFPPVAAKGGRRGRRERYRAYTDRAKTVFAAWAGATAPRRSPQRIMDKRSCPVHNPSMPEPLTPGQRLARGTARHLTGHGFACLTEFVPVSGLRVDLIALGAKGEIWVVECKSGLADFRADAKWQGYLAWCDRFFWAVGPEFPAEILPAGTGLIRADDYDAAIVAHGGESRLAPARRAALTRRVAQQATLRLARLSDPMLEHVCI